MSHPVTVPFDLTGEFIGFRFTAEGKRRLLLRVVGGDALLLKVPRPLRRRMIGNYRPGQVIRVAGAEERDPAGEHGSRWVVSDVLSLDAAGAPKPAALPAGPIRVCAKKNCWRGGGRELCAALEQEIETRGLAGEVRVKAVGCLDRCNQGPNVDWDHHEFSRCQREDIATILDRLPATAPATDG